ncbi:YeeE/YedE family protein [Vibrio tritonius]|uniref:YeeE/YedE family protein n=1 Tax=Vibrio tritonius TaxID=1435069 RepID=A0ABS7YRJ9_9VIBR|nr:YeeE/YedE family protein [Vibrio tritonius]MCA2017496.1 YeeE/YedE family protein [Vibrio tritonius]
MNKQQAWWALGVAVATLVFGALYLKSDALYLRLLLGLALGFALTKGSIGFAGSVNRAYRRGSTQLLQTLMFMFVITSVVSAGLLLNAKPGDYHLWVNPINAGLLIGGLMFGAGMSLSSCCATGVMVEMVGDIPRALITLFFFGFGVFLGFPLQATQTWIRQTWFSTSSYSGKGVFLPDLLGGPLQGYFWSVIVTAGLALFVSWCAKRYQASRQAGGTFYGVDGEILRQQQAAVAPSVDYRVWSKENYQQWLGNVWQMRSTALVIAIIFGIMMATTGAGWGASTPFGLWFGKLLISLGMNVQDVAAYSHKPEAIYTLPLLEHSVTVQNFAILLGTLIAVLLLGKGAFNLKPGYTVRHYSLFAFGGLLMGLGTRFANGCNVGALFTPIANFSLSGWVFLIVLLLGGILGNQLHSRVLKQC